MLIHVGDSHVFSLKIYDRGITENMLKMSTQIKCSYYYFRGLYLHELSYDETTVLLTVVIFIITVILLSASTIKLLITPYYILIKILSLEIARLSFSYNPLSKV